MEEYQQSSSILTVIVASAHYQTNAEYLLAPLGEDTVLERTIHTVRQARSGKEFTILTTLDEADRPLRKFCLERNLPYIADRPGDMLQALLNAAQMYEANIIARCHGTQPFLSARMLDAAASWALTSEMDYVTVDSIPAGIASEALPTRTLATLLAQNRTSKNPAETLLREAQYDCAFLPAPLHWRRPNLRLTLNDAEDFALAQRIFAEVPRRNHGAHRYEDILAYLEARSESELSPILAEALAFAA